MRDRILAILSTFVAFYAYVFALLYTFVKFILVLLWKRFPNEIYVLPYFFSFFNKGDYIFQMMLRLEFTEAEPEYFSSFSLRIPREMFDFTLRTGHFLCKKKERTENRQIHASLSKYTHIFSFHSLFIHSLHWQWQCHCYCYCVCVLLKLMMCLFTQVHNETVGNVVAFKRREIDIIRIIKMSIYAKHERNTRPKSSDFL